MAAIIITFTIAICGISFMLGAIIAGGRRSEYETRILMLEDAAEDALTLLRRIHKQMDAKTDWYEISQLEQALTYPESEK